MPWETMPFGERAQMVVATFKGILAQDIEQTVLNEWASRTYPDTWHGEQQAIQDLMQMLRDASMSDVQRAHERHRLAQQIKDNTDKVTLIEDEN
jgi:hypothetical protein